jgi:hypothetical protein
MRSAGTPNATIAECKDVEIGSNNQILWDSKVVPSVVFLLRVQGTKNPFNAWKPILSRMGRVNLQTGPCGATSQITQANILSPSLSTTLP